MLKQIILLFVILFVFGAVLKIAFAVIGVAIALTFKLVLAAVVIGAGVMTFKFVKRKLIEGR
jgi:hypothetical protein